MQLGRTRYSAARGRSKDGRRVAFPRHLTLFATPAAHATHPVAAAVAVAAAVPAGAGVGAAGAAGAAGAGAAVRVVLGVRKQPKASKPFQLDFSEGDVSAAHGPLADASSPSRVYSPPLPRPPPPCRPQPPPQPPPHPSQVSPASVVPASDREAHSFRLAAVVCHAGASTDCGHYFACALPPARPLPTLPLPPPHPLP